MELKKFKDTLRGVDVVMVTPFDEKLNVDIPGLRKLVRFIIDNGLKEGVGVLTSTGSTGECPMLSVEERKRILEVIVEEAKGEVPVIAGCNHASTMTVVELVKHAESAGASGVMVSPPYYWAPTEQVILEHYRKVAEATNLGILVYNNYFASQVDIPIPTLRKLSQIDNIVALKENTAVLGKLIQVVEAVRDELTVISGLGERHEPYASFIGTKGFVSSLANFAPRISLEIYETEKAGKYEEAKRLHSQLMPLFKLVWWRGDGDSSRYISYVKEIVRMRGIISHSAVRPPILPMDESKKEKLRNQLRTMGLVE